MTWGGSDGDWSIPTNWTSGTVPGSGTDALIDSGTATLPDSYTGATSTITVGNSGTASLVIDGTLNSGAAILGADAGSSGYLEVDNGGLWNTQGTLTIGGAGAGALTIEGGMVSTGISQPVYIGYNNSAGTGAITVNGGTFNTNGGAVYIGGAGSGLFEITNGGYASTGDAYVFDTPPFGSGGVYIGGTWNAGNISTSGSAQFSIEGGSVTATSATFNSEAMIQGESQGGLQISNSLVVGQSGSNGSLMVESSVINTGTGLTIIGSQVNSAGTVTFTSNDSTWNGGSGDFIIGALGNGRFNAGNNKVSAANVIIGDGTLPGSGSSNSSAWGWAGSGTWNISGTLTVGNVGSGTFAGSSLTVGSGTGAIVLASAPGSSGILIDIFSSGGPFASTFNAGTVTGGSGFGEIVFNLLQTTGTVTPQLTGNLTIFQACESNFVFTGSNTYSGTTNIQTGTIQVGNGGTGGSLGTSTVLLNDTLVIDRSGTLAISGNITGPGNTLGKLVQIGPGTTILSGSDNYGSTTINSGTLEISNGVFTQDQNILIGNLSGSQAGLIITGTSTVNGTIFLGAVTGASASGTIGSGSVTINGGVYLNAMGGATSAFNIAGGNVSVQSTSIGFLPGSVGVVTITGGTLNESDFLTVGVSGTGTLNLSGSGVLNVAGGSGTVTIASGSVIGLNGSGTSAVGTLNISGGTLNAATVTSGSGSSASVNFTNPGTMTFTPALTGTLTVTQSGSGNTILTGSSTYTGSTNVTSGALTVNGSITAPTTVATSTLNGSGATGKVIVNSGGMLAGTLSSGTVAVNNSGTLSPGGTSPGADSMVSLSLGTGATYQAAIAAPNGGSYTGPSNHPVAGSDYSQSVITGSSTELSLNNAGSILQLNITGTLPSAGIGVLGSTYNASSSNFSLDNYFILNLSNGSATITGSFAEASLDGGAPVTIDYSASNLAGGANGDGSFTLNGQDWIISYDGNAATNSTNGGNDIVLTAVTPQQVPAHGAWMAFVLLGIAGMFTVGAPRVPRRQ